MRLERHVNTQEKQKVTDWWVNAYCTDHVRTVTMALSLSLSLPLQILVLTMSSLRLSSSQFLNFCNKRGPKEHNTESATQQLCEPECFARVNSCEAKQQHFELFHSEGFFVTNFRIKLTRKHPQQESNNSVKIKLSPMDSYP